MGKGIERMTGISKNWFPLLVASLLASAPGAAAQIPFPTTLHVNPETGSDAPSQSGSLSHPLASVNEALQRAWDVQQPPLGFLIDTIKVYASSVPIAPDPTVFGGAFAVGKELAGWKKDPSDPDLPPFPIRMLPNVDILGIAVAGQKPRIVIDEEAALMAYPNSLWDGYPFDPTGVIPPSDPFWCMVRGASNARLDGFIIDGEKLMNPRVSRWPGVYANGVTGFDLSNCEIHHFHDELRFAAQSGVGLRARVTDCILRDAWPFTDLGSTETNEEDFGHAHAWVIGTGALGVTFLRTTFVRAHDGIEAAPEGAMASIHLTVSDCRFDKTENGLEVVGNGVTTYSVDNTTFIDCHNLPPPDGGTGVSLSTGAVVDRASAANFAEIRSCDFRNFGWGLITSGSTSLDMGMAGSLGLNNFCLDFSLFTEDPLHASIGGSSNPYRVALFNRSTAAVSAVGNFWLRSNQFANAFGFMTISGASGSSINLPNMSGVGGTVAEPGPPGPLWKHLKDDAITPWERNYSIQAGTITFGVIDPGTGPDCSVDP